MNLPLIIKNLKVVLFGHILNPFWNPRKARRARRGSVSLAATSEYLSKYLDFIRQIKVEESTNEAAAYEKVFTIWLQGEEAAPPIVKSCIKSMKSRCKQEVIVLDAESISERIALPDYILRKYKEGKIRAAHFADICRVELLYRYGGVWLDATCLVSRPVPDFILNEDFFVFMGGNSIFGSYGYIQNCFIRSRKGNFLIQAWRDIIFEYWKNEDCAVDYFVHQILFKLLVENNSAAAERFATMPKIDQDPTHELWPHKRETYSKALFDELCSGAFFQKTEFKSKAANKPPKGSIADYVINL